MGKEEIQIAFILDDTYIIPALVALYSLKRNNSHNNLSIYILKSGGKDIRKLFNIFKEDNFRIQIINLQEEAATYIFDPLFHVSPAAIAKFRLGSILPNVSKLLYLDCDLLVCGDLLKLWQTDLGNNYGAFVKDIKPIIKYRHNHLETLKIQAHKAYYNSGVILLNLEKIRRDEIEKKLFAYRKNGLNNFMDQDAINVVMGSKVVQLDLKYNFLVTLAEEFCIDDINRHYKKNLSERDLKSCDEFKIIHFSSNKKPWNSGEPLAADLWREYLANFLNEYSAKLGEYDKSWNRQIIVSLTSYGMRIKTVHKVIECLKNQSLKYEKLILWLAKDELAAKPEKLPWELRQLQDELFEIRFCRDLKSYKKLIPSLEVFQQRIIVTADDDQYYNRHWLLELFLSYLEFPEAIHCHRGHRLNFSMGQLDNYNHWAANFKQIEPSCLLFPTGCGGILYPPHCFTREIFREEIFMNKCASGDDIWFWAMALMKDRTFRIAPASSFTSISIEGTQENSLFHINMNKNVNDLLLKYILFYYPFIRRKLLSTYYGRCI